jgi:hypothetical protein
MKFSITEYKPIIIVQVYLLIVLIIFAFGPWPWLVKNPLTFYGYLLLNQFIIFLGYQIGINQKEIYQPKTNRNNTFSLIKISAILNLVLLIPTYIALTPSLEFSVSHVITNLINGITNPGEQYMQKIVTESSNLRTFLNLIISIPAAIVWLYIPLSITFWAELTSKYKILLLFITASNIIMWISIGTNKGIFDLLFIIISVYLIINSIKSNVSRSLNKLLIQRISLISFIVLTLFSFVNAINSRIKDISIVESMNGIEINSSSIFIKYTPESLHTLIILLSAYLTQGYYGLSLAMQFPFVFCYGVGNSNFLFRFADKLFNSQISEMTYPGRIEQVFDWYQFVHWHSAYTWWASDVSFIGVPIVLFFLGKLLANVWLDILRYRNPYAIGLFTLLFILFLYLPANNQIFGFSMTFFAFWGLFYLWKRNLH